LEAVLEKALLEAGLFAVVSVEEAERLVKRVSWALETVSLTGDGLFWMVEPPVKESEWLVKRVSWELESVSLPEGETLFEVTPPVTVGAEAALSGAERLVKRVSLESEVASFS
jgi:hypothetical protein